MMADMPYMVKTLQKSSSLELAGRFSRNMVCSNGGGVVVCQPFSKIFFSETACLIEAKFYVDGKNKSVFATYWSHDFDGRHAQIW